MSTQDGKIVEHWGAPDRFALLAQLGLLPQGKPLSKDKAGMVGG